MLRILVAGVGVYFYLRYKKAKKNHEKNMVAFNNSRKILLYEEIDDAILSVIQPYSDTQKAYTFIYNYENMPFGRASAFLNYHNVSIYDEEPYIFLCKRSSKDNEFREYGCIVGRKGIYYCIENSKNGAQKDKDPALPGTEKFYPYKGLANVEKTNTSVVLTYIEPNKKTDSVKRIAICDKNELELIFRVLQTVVSAEIGFSLHRGIIVDNIDGIEKMVNTVFGNSQNAYNYYIQKANRAESTVNQKGYNAGLNYAGVQSSQPQFNAFYVENKNYMNGAQGHGYAAEYGNNAVDRFFLKNVENTAQNLENGHQIKYGADRTVNGVEYQTKYYKSPADSVGSVFNQGQAKYIRTDGSGKMMTIEVPRDQYLKALQEMQKRIDNGQVPNVERGEDARDYVRKGHFTYEQSFCIAQSGTIESLTVDAMSGAVCCIQAAGITSVIVFAMCLWRGVPVQEALKQSLSTGLVVLGKGTLIYTLTMQLSRENFANIFAGKNIVDGVSKGFNTVNNPIFDLSENLASKISSSGIGNSTIGKTLGLNNTSGKQIVGGAVTVAVVFGPDIARALTGRISTKQLAKNATVGVVGIAGAAIGQTLIPIPIVGGMIGGGISGFVAKKTLDHFVEDDAKEMFRILKEEFLEVIMMAGLNNDEFEQVVQLTIGSKKISKEFQKMFQSGEPRSFANEKIMIPAVNEVISKRQIITEENYDQGLKLLAAG